MRIEIVSEGNTKLQHEKVTAMDLPYRNDRGVEEGVYMAFLGDGSVLESSGKFKPSQ